MTTETQKLIDEQFQKLPRNFQEAISSVPWGKVAGSILDNLNLSSEQKEAAKREITLIIYGFEAPATLVENLIKEAFIPPNDALAIAEKCSTEVFEIISKKAAEFAVRPAQEPKTTPKDAKKEVMGRLMQRVEVARQGGASVKPIVPKPAEEIHPMVKSGEVAHEVPHVETPAPQTPVVSSRKPEPLPTPATTTNPEPTLQNPEPIIKNTPPEEKKAPIPANSPYPGGLDPYREPLV